jgi:CheY-like chemotaxis protein
MIKVLYAEDNDGMRKMVSHFLKTVGFDVVITTDGDEALEAASKEKFDIILLDVTMERVDGTIAAQKIKQQQFNIDTPIIGLTGRTEQSEIEACKNSGMDVVLAKPVNLEVLAETLANGIEIKNANMQSDDATNVTSLDEKSANNIAISPPKIIEVEVLRNYSRIAGNSSLEGILRDFSDLWPRKIGELYSAIVLEESDCFARAGEELAAIAAGVGAGKVAKYAGLAVSLDNNKKRGELLPDIVIACNEVQGIINAISAETNINLRKRAA